MYNLAKTFSCPMVSEYKLVYYLACIGNPDLDKKLNILEHNLNYIYNNTARHFNVIINCYETDDNTTNIVYSTATKFSFVDNCFIHVRKGVLTELFKTNPHNDILKKYDYVLFILDDIKIINIDLLDMIRIKEKHSIEILSPQITNGSHSFMRTGTNITIHNFLEVFFLLMQPVDFFKFCSIHTLDNKWMWGVDHLFGFYNIRAGVINKYSVNHEQNTRSSKMSVAMPCMLEYLKQRTPYKNLDDIKKVYAPISEEIAYE